MLSSIWFSTCSACSKLRKYWAARVPVPLAGGCGRGRCAYNTPPSFKAGAASTLAVTSPCRFTQGVRVITTEALAEPEEQRAVAAFESICAIEATARLAIGPEPS